MRQRTVWLRPDPVGSKSTLPTREEFRARFARTSIVAGCLGLLALAVFTVLRVLVSVDSYRNPLVAIGLCFGIAGIGAGAIAVRTPSLRGRALTGIGISAAALIGSPIVVRLVDLAGG